MNKETVNIEELRKQFIELRSTRRLMVDEEELIANAFEDTLEIGNLYDVTLRSDYPMYRLITDISRYDSEYEPDEAIHAAMSDSYCTCYVEVLFIHLEDDIHRCRVEFEHYSPDYILEKGWHYITTLDAEETRLLSEKFECARVNIMKDFLKDIIEK